MLHPAADSQPNPNNSKTHVGGRAGAVPSLLQFTTVQKAATSLLPPCGPSLHPTR